MRGNVDLGFVELSEEDLALTAEEQAREDERKVEMVKEEIKEHAETIEEVDAPNLVIEGLEDTSERKNAAMEILEKEKALQLEREKEWLKTKKRNKRKRIAKCVILIAIAVFLALAWLSGFRIEIPQAWIETFNNMWYSVREFVINFFTHN